MPGTGSLSGTFLREQGRRPCWILIVIRGWSKELAGSWEILETVSGEAVMLCRGRCFCLVHVVVRRSGGCDCARDGMDVHIG